MPNGKNNANRAIKRARLFKTHLSSPTQTDESLALLNTGIKMPDPAIGMSARHMNFGQRIPHFACGIPFLEG
jgi:hypothetical protein